MARSTEISEHHVLGVWKAERRKRQEVTKLGQTQIQRRQKAAIRLVKEPAVLQGLPGSDSWGEIELSVARSSFKRWHRTHRQLQQHGKWGVRLEKKAALFTICKQNQTKAN